MPSFSASGVVRMSRAALSACRVLGVVMLFPTTAAAEVSAERAATLEHIVVQDCGSCHGLTRKGGLGSPLTSDALSHADRETLALIILDGVPGTAMPPWRPLMTEDEALWIADYLKRP